MYDLEYVMESHGHARPKEVKKKRDAKVESCANEEFAMDGKSASDGSTQTASVSVA